MAPADSQSSFLATRRGKLTLALLCAVAFLDIIDASIVNLALPSMRHALQLVGSFFILASAVIALRATNTRRDPRATRAAGPARAEPAMTGAPR